MNEHEPITQEMLLRYLLNEMSPEERERVDASLIADSNYSDAFQEAEYDLLDAYSTNELPPETADRIRRALAVWPHGWITLPVSRAIQKRVNEVASQPQSVSASHRRSRLPVLAWLPVLAALLILVVVLGWQHQRASRSTSARVALTPQPAMTPTLPVTPPAAQPSVPSTPTSPSVRTSQSTAMLLLPEISRDAAPMRVHLAPRIRELDVEWVLPSGPSQDALHLTLTDSKGNSIRVSQHGGIQTVGRERVAHFYVDTHSLAPDAYMIRIFGAADPTTPVYEASIRFSH